MAWAAISADGERILHFLGPNETMTAARYEQTLVESGAVELMRKSGLKLYHDGARVHTANNVSNMLQKAGVKSKTSPGTSPDLMPIENAFGRIKQILEKRPTKNLAQLRSEVQKAWNELPSSYLCNLCNSMPVFL